MNNKFGRDDRYRNDDGYRNDERRDRDAREPLWRGTEGDRAARSPDQEFETSGPYREPYGEIDSRRDPRSSRPSGGTSSYDRSRFDGTYAPSPYTVGPDRNAYGSNAYGTRDQSYRGRDIGGWSSDARGGHTGKGPKGYTRTDDRIREDVCDRLSWNDEVDATDIVVRVENAEVTLEGSVETRHMKRLAEDLAEDVPGVRDVHNTVRVQKAMLTELKEKISGEAHEGHYANTGTKTTSGGMSAPNGH